MEYIIIIISSAFISNVVLSRFLGICPFIGVSNKVESAKGMGIAVIAVIMIATVVTYGLNVLFLEESTSIFKIDLTYLRTIVFILVIACLVQLLELILKRYIPSLYKGLGIYLPLITTNCAVLGVVLTVAQDYSSFLKGMAYAFGTSAGFCISIILLASIRERIESNDIPESFKGKPIVLVTACLMAIAFTGFANLNIG